MKEQFITKDFKEPALALIDASEQIINEYTQAGYTLTLRQLYYQLVARALIENKKTEYDRLGSVISDARLAGLIDWAAIEDRTRNLQRMQLWDNPAHIIRAARNSYRENYWRMQPCHVEVWVEKEALAGVIEKACEPYHVGHLACRGYMSQSEAYVAGKRFEEIVESGRQVHVLHLGDHDPSGIDMTRDNRDRLAQLSNHCGDIHVTRLALNMEQVEELGPPPNPAKLTDSRCRGYISKYGHSSWELDALDPEYITDLISDNIEALIDIDLWDDAKAMEQESIDKLNKLLEQADD